LDTEVESTYGAITVVFDPAIQINVDGMPTLRIRAYDGRVEASNIVGVPDIFVSVNGRATVDARFRQIITGRIEYEGSTRRGRNIGNVDVRVARDIPYSIIEIVDTRGAHNRTNTTPPMLTTMQHEAIAFNQSLVNGASYHIRYADGGTVSTGNLRISTSNTFNFHVIF